VGSGTGHAGTDGNGDTACGVGWGGIGMIFIPVQVSSCDDGLSRLDSG